MKLAERIKVNFLQVIGGQKDRLLEFFALKLLDNLRFWPIGDVRPEKLRSLPPSLTIAKFGDIEIGRVPMSAGLTTPGT